jgi:hypothetical protein
MMYVVAKLEPPGTPVPYFHETEAIDHNLYIEGGLFLLQPRLPEEPNPGRGRGPKRPE